MTYDLSKKLDREQFKEKSNYLFMKGFEVELKQVRKKRSLNQNNYLHVVITLFSIEYGEDIETMKQILKYWYGLFEKKKDAIIYGKTSKMDSKELTTFIEWIRNKSSKDMGYYIPTSEEYLENQSEINRLMYQNKQYT